MQRDGRSIARVPLEHQVDVLPQQVQRFGAQSVPEVRQDATSVGQQISQPASQPVLEKCLFNALT